MIKQMLILFLLTASAYASVFDFAEKQTGIPAKLLQAVAETESGLHPYAFAVWTKQRVNKLDESCKLRRKINGKFLYNGCIIKNKAGAYAFLNFLLSSKDVVNFSVGLMQVNSCWIKVLNVEPAVLLDRKMNVLLGALILKYYLELEKNYLKALSRYYGSNRIATGYLLKIYKHLTNVQ